MKKNTNINESILSKKPPWPINKLPVSFKSDLLLINDTMASPVKESMQIKKDKINKLNNNLL